MTPYMHHTFGGEITMKFEIVELIGPKAFVICVQDLMIQTSSQKSIMICTIGGSKMLAVRNMTIKFLYIIINLSLAFSLMNGYKGLDILQCKLKRT